MKRPPGARLVALFVVMVLAFGGITVRLGFLQLTDQRAYAAMGYQQRVHTLTLPAARGMILDSSGVPLAMTVQARDVYVDPQLVTDPMGEAAALAPLLGLKFAKLLPVLTGTGSFVYLARQVTPALGDKILALKLAGVGSIPVTARTYPAGPLASQVLGFVGVDGSGLTGLEREYQPLLAGAAGHETVELSPGGQSIPDGVHLVQAPVPGKTLVTTIDRQIQYQAQQYLRQAVEQNQAKGGTIIVMDPKTGDIYAMASYPWFDPNNYAVAAAKHPGALANRAVTDSFEPGSVNKIITAAAALEVRAVSLTERFAVPWSQTIGTYTIHDSHVHPIEQMTIGDIIVQSSNIGASMVGQRVGAPMLATYLARFGFGQPTGLGFPGEASGIVPGTPSWTDTSLATISYGQGISVTPLQMASVYATIANGGTLVQPRLILGTKDAAGVFTPVPASPTRPVIRRSTADALTQMLAMVVQDGTGVNAQIPGYQVAGKTGTALIPDPAGGYYQGQYVASFIGFLPASAPRVVVAAIIDRPTTVYGGVAAAPLFQQVARYAIRRLGIATAPPVQYPPSALTRP